MRDPDLDVLVAWFCQASTQNDRIGLIDTGQMLLCARDLNVSGFHLQKALRDVTSLDDPPEHQRQRIVLSFLRQIVLLRYNRNADEREAFFDYWLSKKNRTSVDIVSQAYIVGMALEQMDLVPKVHRDYVQEWFARKELKADRVRGWVPHYLRLSGKDREARERAQSFLGERESNGSWHGGYDSTLAILYALLYSGLVERKDLRSTIGYIGQRFDGKCTGDNGTDALALKALFRSDLLHEKQHEIIRGALRRASGVFLSHSSKDKLFVRKLAKDLEPFGVWLDEQEVKVGDSIVSRVQDALESCAHIVIVLSEASVTSDWVKKEVNLALNMQLSGKGTHLLPALIEDCEVPGFLRELKYADFRDSYENGLRDLLRGLGG